MATPLSGNNPSAWSSGQQNTNTSNEGKSLDVTRYANLQMNQGAQSFDSASQLRPQSKIKEIISKIFS